MVFREVALEKAAVAAHFGKGSDTGILELDSWNRAEVDDGDVRSEVDGGEGDEEHGDCYRGRGT